jgi:hypothetical protein
VLGRIDRKLDGEGDEVTNTGGQGRRLAQRLAPDRNFLIGIVVLVIATASLGISGANEASNRNFRNHQARITACQTQYNETVVRVVAARADAASQDRDTLDNLLKTVATATQPTQVEAALQKYIKDRASADAERARSPLPEPPNCKEVQ